MHLVFVHLGAASAEHLWLNIKRHRKYFPDLPVTLIYSDSSFVEKKYIKGLSLYKYQIKSGNESPVSNLSHDNEFRKGFWRYSIERLYALSDWHQNNPKEKLLHLESDILPLVNFPFDQISKEKNLAWCRFNETHDVASILYSPDPERSRWLIDELDKELESNNQLTDMTSLRVISRNHPKKVTYLNSVEREDSYKGHFDAAPFGMWLAGRDPRNHRGFVRRFMALPESDISPEKYRYSFNRKGEILMIDPFKVERPLFDLHIHSKSKLLFGKYWKIYLAYLIFSSRILFPKVTFSPTAFTRIVIDFRIRHANLGLREQIIKLVHFK